MSTPDDPYAAPSGDQPEQPSTGQPAYPPPAQPNYGQPTYGQPTYGQPQNPNPGYAPGYGPTPGYGGQPPYGAPPQQPGYAGPYVQPGYAFQPTPRTNGMAIAALVCSLAAFAVCVSAPVGVILGFVALSQIKRSGEGGRGLAIAGIWIGAVFTVVVALIIAVIIGFAVNEANKCDNGTYTGRDYQVNCVDGPFGGDTSDDDTFTNTSWQFA